MYLYFVGNYKLEKGWLVYGKIEFRNVSLKYDKDLEKVVINVLFIINFGEKVRSL